MTKSQTEARKGHLSRTKAMPKISPPKTRVTAQRSRSNKAWPLKKEAGLNTVMQRQKHIDSSRNRQRLDTAGERACKSSEPLKLNHPKMHPLTICNAQPYECILSSPLSQGRNFSKSHITLHQMQRKMSYTTSPPCWQWDSSSESQGTHEGHSPWNEPPPKMQLTLKICHECKWSA